MLKSTLIQFAGRVGAALIVLGSSSIDTRLLSPVEDGVHALIASGMPTADASI